MPLRGTFAETDPEDVLQMLALGGKTGLLTVTAERHTTKLVFREGAIVDAFDGIQRGEDAVFGLLASRTGSFAFTPQDVSPERTIERSVPAILLDAARRLDDLTRARELLRHPTARPYRVSGPHPGGHAELGEVEASMLALVDGRRSLGEIVGAAEMSAELAYGALGLLAERGLVALVTADQEGSPLTGDTGGPQPSGSPETVGATAPSGPPMPEELREIADHLRQTVARPAEESGSP